MYSSEPIRNRTCSAETHRDTRRHIGVRRHTFTGTTRLLRRSLTPIGRHVAAEVQIFELTGRDAGVVDDGSDQVSLDSLLDVGPVLEVHCQTQVLPHEDLERHTDDIIIHQHRI